MTTFSCLSRGEKILIISLLAICFVTIIYFGQGFFPTKGKITCVDGDTFAIDKTYYRLVNIDTPEKGERGYQEASNYTCMVLSNEDIHVWEKGKDIYGRTLADVIILRTGSSLSNDLIQYCLAEPFYKKSTNHIIKTYFANCYENWKRDDK